MDQGIKVFFSGSKLNSTASKGLLNNLHYYIYVKKERTSFKVWWQTIGTKGLLNNLHYYIYVKKERTSFKVWWQTIGTGVKNNFGFFLCNFLELAQSFR